METHKECMLLCSNKTLFKKQMEGQSSLWVLPILRLFRQWIHFQLLRGLLKRSTKVSSFTGPPFLSSIFFCCCCWWFGLMLLEQAPVSGTGLYIHRRWTFPSSQSALCFLLVFLSLTEHWGTVAFSGLIVYMICFLSPLFNRSSLYQSLHKFCTA